MDNQELKINEIEKRIVEIEKKLFSIESVVFSKSAQKQERHEECAKILSIKEFVLIKKPKDDIQRALAIGYFLEHYDGLPSFNAKDLASGFEKAKEKMPVNINDKVNKNIMKGHMMEAKEKRNNLTSWLLTNSGEHFVDSNLPVKK